MVRQSSPLSDVSSTMSTAGCTCEDICGYSHFVRPLAAASNVRGPWRQACSMAALRSPVAAARLHPLWPALDGNYTGTRDLDQAERDHQIDEALDLVGGPGNLEHEALGAGIDHAGAERVGKPQSLDPVVAGAAHFHHRELALDRRTRYRHIDHAMNRHQPLELVLDLLDN